jgi:DNA invertase Pin-like site-specific DNA recombinase
MTSYVTKYVAYYRVKKPKSPNFDLRAQKAAVRQLGTPEEEFTEVEKPRHYTRPTLDAAIAHAQESRAILVIAKLGRLVHNVSVTQALLAHALAGGEFICCDQPTTNHLTIHILAALADETGRDRSQRMRDTYARQKAEGQQLGSARAGHWDGRERGWKKAVKAASAQRIKTTAHRYQYLMPGIQKMREEGQSLAEIVEWLNSRGHLTTALKPFTQTAVWRIIKRYLGNAYLGRRVRA